MRVDAFTTSKPKGRIARGRRSKAGMLALISLTVVALPAAAQEAPPERPAAVDADGPAYAVSAFELRYFRDHPDLPDVDVLSRLGLVLGTSATGYVAPREGVPTVEVQIAGPFELSHFHASAVQRVLERIRDELVARDLLGVYVAPDPIELAPTGEDLRAADDTTLGILITAGLATELRTLASGERIPAEERINHPLHQRIRDRSPIQPSRDDRPPDLLRKGALDDYVFHLSRHPGRRVDVALSAAEEPGGVALDYLVTENNPLVLYFQASNTGTKQTGYWRERFGLLHSQLRNEDDILSLDYTTAEFRDTHAVQASYETPFFDNDRIRWRVHGGWSEYMASEVGFFGDDFEGESYWVGGEVIANVLQERELFVDLLAGVRFQNVMGDNRAVLIQGEEDFVIPHVGLRLDRTSEWYSTIGQLTLEWQDGSVTSVDPAELTGLGRFAPDEDWTVMRWSLSHSFYLEPVLNRAAWEDPTSPETSTLAHEIALSVRGQYAFGHRLIPQEEHVVGGLYSVRGYPESVVAGDDVVIGSIEYRYHLPHAFGVEPEPRELFGEPFRAAPQYVYGRPDWDLILKGFLDIGRAENTRRFSFERDETLIGAGVGIEFLYKRNLNARLDWGFALEEVEAADVDSGANRLHFVITILF